MSRNSSFSGYAEVVFRARLAGSIKEQKLDDKIR